MLEILPPRSSHIFISNPTSSRHRFTPGRCGTARPLRRSLIPSQPGISVAVAAYGAPPGAVSSGYGPDGGTVVAARQRHQSRSRGQHHPSIPPSPYSAHHHLPGPHPNPYSPYGIDNASPTYTTSASSGGGNYTTSPAPHGHFEIPAAKRQRISDAGISRRPSQTTSHSATASPRNAHAMDGPSPPSFSRETETSTGREKAVSRRESESRELVPPSASPSVAKPKRVRTGCLTCRNRHLKCDEALPTCLNCQKSNRKCERGVRLNFIDLKVEQPPVLLPPVDWKGRLDRAYIERLERGSESLPQT